MSVSVYFGDSKAVIPDGASFKDCPSFDGCIAVVDGEGKTVAIVSIAGMLMIEIDAATNGDDDAKAVEAAAEVAAPPA